MLKLRIGLIVLFKIGVWWMYERMVNSVSGVVNLVNIFKVRVMLINKLNVCSIYIKIVELLK